MTPFWPPKPMIICQLQLTSKTNKLQHMKTTMQNRVTNNPFLLHNSLIISKSSKKSVGVNNPILINSQNTITESIIESIIEPIIFKC